MFSNDNNVVLLARKAIGITTTEAAQLAHVTRRTWEMWEAGERQVPIAKLNYFLSKISRECLPNGELIVIFNNDQIPVDVAAEDKFLSISDVVKGCATIKSMAVNRLTKQPYVHRTAFHVEPYNTHVMRITSKWKSVLSD